MGAITRVADVGTEVELVELATHATASQLDRVVRAWRRSDDVDEEQVAEKRSFQWHWDADGMLVLQVRTDGESGAALLAAVESLVEREIRRERAAAKKQETGPAEVDDDVCPEDPRTFPQERMSARRCRALVQLAETAAEAGRRAGDPPRREVVVHVDADLLADDAAAGRAHLEGGPALTVIVERNGEPLALGRRRRLATKAQRRALLARDGGCVRPSCTETRIERLHAHHLLPGGWVGAPTCPGWCCSATSTTGWSTTRTWSWRARKGTGRARPRRTTDLGPGRHRVRRRAGDLGAAAHAGARRGTAAGDAGRW